MIYEYEDVETGETVELFKPASKADKVYAVIRHEGRQLRRLPSVKAHQVAVEDRPRARHSLPRWLPGCSAYDKRGRPVISNAEGRRMGLVENPHLDEKD